ncbi:GNAT family N-acetyltransferase [Zobellia roscoffensis]|uniref:GNAT family N-acetyltransferase n=1 Tax=Zobellia roscoffensis TaxID=2779508 RepID=UPI00188BF5BC|nr:GNAT family N-acetyltransferase [Zobellia roscoffensis]
MDLLLEGEKTERLLFRKVLPSDFDTWLPFHEDKRSSEFWKGLPSDPKIACRQQFNRIFERYENDLGTMNALILKSTGDLIGLCGLLKQNVDNIEELEIGYSILPKYWKQGYASEAAKKCKMHARNNRLAPSLISIIHIDNIPSQRVAMNNGMHLEKTTTYHNNPVYIFRVLL